jgi:hypothetical protein
MKRWIIALVLLAGVLAPWTIVNAQTNPEIERMQIDLWPEYDKPDVLVIYRITLTATPSMPVQMNLKIPKASGAPSSLAMKDVDGLLYNLKYDQTVEGDWIRISFTAPAAEIQLEYYDPGMTRNGPERKYTFRWPGDTRVRSMVLRLQQPVNASDLQLVNSPLKMSEGAQADDGLTYYNVPIDGTVEAGAGFSAALSYTKSDSVLSSSQTPVQPVRTAAGGTTALSNGLLSDTSTLWMVAAAGIILILAGVFWFLQQRSTVAAHPPVRRRHTYTPARTSNVASAVSPGPVYCHQCGKRANSGDAFCRSCGVKLRTES